MAAALEPARLADLVDLAERPRVEGWSLRAALCRYAQPQPERAGALLSVLRRVEAELGQHLAELRSHGPELMEQAQQVGSSPAAAGEDLPLLVGLLALAAEIDEVATAIATWSVDRSGARPDIAIDEITSRAATRLAQLGVAEEAPPPRGSRSRG